MHRIATHGALVGYCFLLSATGCTAEAKEWKSGKEWPIPVVVDPGSAPKGPSDSIVLFDGTDFSAWKGGPWKVADGVMTAGGGHVQTKQAFGSCQLHIEFATPEKVKGSGQSRGNSGVFLMGRYELQILDSFANETYPDGQCAAIYKQTPPLVNVCRRPGEWQSYDIIFMAPKFTKDGALEKPATITVLQNGVLVQNHFELEGATAWEKAPEYKAHADRLPIMLQDHGNPTRFRNIWIRELDPAKADAGS